MWDNLRKPTDKQREELLRMLHLALLEIRILGWDNKADQCADIADAFHNVPAYLETEDFSFEFLKEMLGNYKLKYPDHEGFDYLKMLDKIMEDEK